MRKEYKVYTREEKRQYAIKMYKSPPTKKLMLFWKKQYDQELRGVALVEFEAIIECVRMHLEAVHPKDNYNRDFLCFYLKYLYEEVLRNDFDISKTGFIQYYSGDITKIPNWGEFAWLSIAERIIRGGGKERAMKPFRMINYDPSFDGFAYVPFRVLSYKESEYTRRLLIEKYYERIKSKRVWILSEISDLIAQLITEGRNNIKLDTTCDDGGNFSPIFHKNLLSEFKASILDLTDEKSVKSLSTEDLKRALVMSKRALKTHSQTTKCFNAIVRASSKEICILAKYCRAVIEHELRLRR